MATAYKLVIPFMMQTCKKYTKGLPKFSVLPTNNVFPTTLFGSKTKGSTWKKNRGPRSSLDMLGLSMMMTTHTTTTKMTAMAIIQTLLSHSRHSSDLKENFKIDIKQSR